MKTCAKCSKHIPDKRLRYKQARFCSNLCSKFYHAKDGTNLKYSGLNTGTIGALHELKVCCDLIERGFQVFRALSPSCECDLAILHNKRLIRVEVTTGYLYRNGRMSWSKHDALKFDLIAIVSTTGISYIPAIESFLCQNKTELITPSLQHS